MKTENREPKTETKGAHWYVGKTGNHQGLVIEEGTGRNVAVAYDKQDAPLLAAAPELLAVLKEALEFAQGHPDRTVNWAEQRLNVCYHSRAAIAKATGQN
jgi:hypothetical protein